jgi:hypothetical protein
MKRRLIAFPLVLAVALIIGVGIAAAAGVVGLNIIDPAWPIGYDMNDDDVVSDDEIVATVPLVDARYKTIGDPWEFPVTWTLVPGAESHLVTLEASFFAGGDMYPPLRNWSVYHHHVAPSSPADQGHIPNLVMIGVGSEMYGWYAYGPATEVANLNAGAMLWRVCVQPETFEKVYNSGAKRYEFVYTSMGAGECSEWFAALLD